LYLRGDPYETSDAVFGVKESLLVNVGKVAERKLAEEYRVEVGTSLISYNFVLVTEAEAANLRREEASKAMTAQGRSCKFLNDLPVPEVD